MDVTFRLTPSSSLSALRHLWMIPKGQITYHPAQCPRFDHAYNSKHYLNASVCASSSAVNALYLHPSSLAGAWSR